MFFSPHSYSVGLIPTKQSLALANNVNASSFCRYGVGGVFFSDSMWIFSISGH